VYKEFYPQGKADKFCAQVFSVFDADNSGRIDFTEFLIAISVSTQKDIKKKLHLAFAMYDTNKNGKKTSKNKVVKKNVKEEINEESEDDNTRRSSLKEDRQTTDKSLLKRKSCQLEDDGEIYEAENIPRSKKMLKMEQKKKVKKRKETIKCSTI